MRIIILSYSTTSIYTFLLRVNWIFEINDGEVMQSWLILNSMRSAYYDYYFFEGYFIHRKKLEWGKKMDRGVFYVLNHYDECYVPFLQQRLFWLLWEIDNLEIEKT